MKCRGCDDDICEKCGLCHGAFCDAEGDDCLDMLKAALKRSSRDNEETRFKFLAAKQLLAKEMGFSGASLEAGENRAFERIDKLASSDEFREKVKSDTKKMIEDFYDDGTGRG